MNILMTLSQLEVTGAEVYAVSVADKLIELGHKVFILSDTLTKKTKANYSSLAISKRTIFFRIRNVIFLIKFIKRNKIHIVNAHSRASAWVSQIACRICNVPLIVFIHGRQATFLSRRIFHAYGDYTIPICEKLEQQLVEVFKVSANHLEVLHNGFDIPKVENVKPPKQKTIAFVTRLSGPKKDLAFKFLEYLVEKTNFFEEFKNVKFKVIGGTTIPSSFEKFKTHFEFISYVENLPREIKNSTVVIGSGRIAIESVLLNKPLVAMGEACTIGLVTNDNLPFAIATNFGDMNVNEKEFDFEKIVNDLKLSLNLEECNPKVYEKVKCEFDINRIVKRLEFVFQSVLMRYHRREIPIIYFHRLVENIDEAGKHGIYVTTRQFEKHLNYLQRKGFRTISFEESLKIKKNCAEGKFVIITFDDGYEDNYRLAFPLLKKYGFSAVIFLVAQLETNSWDEQTNEPVLKMMNKQQILEMQEYGIEFGSHTLTHADLSKLSLEEAKRELVESKKILEEKLGREIKTVAYPYGSCNEGVKKITRDAGYIFAVATDKAPLGLHEDMYQIRRIGIFPNTTVGGLARKVNGDYIFKRVKKDSPYLQIPH